MSTTSIRTTKRFLINLGLRLKTNTIITAFGDAYYDCSDPKYPKGMVRLGTPPDKDGKYPCTRTRRDIIINPLMLTEADQIAIESESDEVIDAAAAAAENTDSKSESGKKKIPGLIRLPILPASKIRGSLHRCFKSILVDLLKEKEDSIELGSYRGLCSGRATGQPDSLGATFEQSVALQRDPVIALFGGGAKLVSSALAGGNFYPICDATIQLNHIPTSYHEFKNPVDPRDMTQVTMRFSGDDTLGSKINPEVLEVVKNASEALPSWANEVGGKAAGIDKKSAKAGQSTNGSEATDDKAEGRSKQGVRNMFALETMVPGLKFFGSFIVDTTMMDHGGLGLFLLALERFVQRQALGAMTASQFGQFDLLRPQITNADDPTAPAEPLFIMNPDTTRWSLNRSSEIVIEALEAWDKFKTTITSKSIDSVYMPMAEGGKRAAKAA